MAFTKIAKKMAVGVIGASKGIGRLLFESLEAKNIEVTGISRNKKDIVVSKDPNTLKWMRISLLS